MNKDELIENIKKLETSNEELYRQKKPIDAKLTRNHNQIQSYKDQLASIESKETKSLDEKIQYFLIQEHCEGMVRLTAAQDFFDAMDIKTGGHYLETMQRCLKIALTYGDNIKTDRVMKSLELILPHIKPHKDGYKHLDIFDRGLNEHNHMVLEVKDNEYNICNLRSYEYKRNHKPLISFNTLEQALDYIQQNFYYDGRED